MGLPPSRTPRANPPSAPTDAVTPARKRAEAVPPPTARPSPEVLPLRVPADGRNNSGYRGVHVQVAEDGSLIARAHVKFGGRKTSLGRRKTAHDAALLVARALRDRYGPGWARLFAVRRPDGSRVDARRRNVSSVWLDDEAGGWVIEVWLRGASVLLEEGGKVLVFATRPEAQAYYRRWKRTPGGPWAAGDVWR